jgi:hypothetical protein
MKEETYKNKPKWLNDEKEKFGKLMKDGTEHEMQDLVGVGAVFVHSICQHNLRIKCHILFEDGHNATSASEEMKMPYGTVKGYFDEYNDEFPS